MFYYEMSAKDSSLWANSIAIVRLFVLIYQAVRTVPEFVYLLFVLNSN